MKATFKSTPWIFHFVFSCQTKKVMSLEHLDLSPSCEWWYTHSASFSRRKTKRVKYFMKVKFTVIVAGWLRTQAFRTKIFAVAPYLSTNTWLTCQRGNKQDFQWLSKLTAVTSCRLSKGYLGLSSFIVYSLSRSSIFGR